MAEIWLTADLHADHKSALKYRTEFSTVDEMADHFVDEHNAVVAPGDRVYNLGDVFFRAKRDVPASLRYLKRLNGQSYLLEGNHDHVDRWPDELTSCFVWVRTRYDLVVSRPDGDVRIVLDHFPLRTWNRRKYGALHAHGHLHDNDHHADVPPTPGTMDVGVDTAKRLVGAYRPFHIDEVVAHIRAGLTP